MNYAKYTGIDPQDPEKKRTLGPHTLLGIGVFQVGEIKALEDDQFNKVMGTNEPYFEKATKAEFEKQEKAKEAAAKKLAVEAGAKPAEVDLDIKEGKKSEGGK